MSKKILLAQLDQKKKSTGISTAETRLSHLFHRDIWQTLGLSSPEVGRPAHLTAASCINDGHQLVHLHTPPWLTGHWHGTAVGAAGGEERGSGGIGVDSPKAAALRFHLQSQPGGSLCLSEDAGHELPPPHSLPASQKNLLFQPSASRLEWQWQCFFPTLTALTLPEILLRVLSIFSVKYDENPSH